MIKIVSHNRSFACLGKNNLSLKAAECIDDFSRLFIP